MPFQLSWMLEGRVLYSRVYGTITDDDDATYDNLIQDYLEHSAGLPVHIITDYSEVEAIQTNIRPTHAPEGMDALGKHPALGCRVAVTPDSNPLLRYFAPLSSYALKPCATTFDVVDDAFEHLCSMDRTLAYGRVLENSAALPQPA